MEPTFKRYGMQSVLIEFSPEISKKQLYLVLAYKKSLENFYVKQKVEIIHAYSSILVFYKNTIEDINDRFLELKQQFSKTSNLKNEKFKLWKIPVCYNEKFGLDLKVISEKNNLSVDEIIQRHTTPKYTIYFTGFLPGFLYLGGLDKQLNFPRRSTPRLMVEKGSVAIGENQTGIYPNASPGGWNIIGNSPLDFFNAKHNPPSFAQAGDQIQFVPIDLSMYGKIKNKVQQQEYKLESEVIVG